MSDIKTLLKEAREAINDKKFLEAQNCCKSILKKDKQNYMALVLLGVALQDSEQAQMAFKKAISLDRNKLLAWQGLLNYYEKINENSKVLQTCEEIIDLQIEENKLEEILKRINEIGKKYKTVEAIKILWKVYQKYENFRELCNELLVDLLKNDKNEINLSNELITIIENIITANKNDESLVLYYTRMLAKKLPVDELTMNILKNAIYKDFNSIKKWLVKFLFEKYVIEENYTIFNHANELSEGIHDCYELKILAAAQLAKNGEYAEAYKKLVNSVNVDSLDTTLIQFLIQCLIKLNKWEATEKLIESMLPFVKDNTLSNKLYKQLLTVLYTQGKCKKACDVAVQLDRKILTEPELGMLAHCLIEEDEDADDIVDLLNDAELITLLKAFELTKKGKYNEALELVKLSSSDHFLKWLVMGMGLWECRDYENSLTPLLKAAKSNPNNALTFLYLGHYYNDHIGDLEKAKKCYSKAYSLNGNLTAAQKLSTIYQQLGNDEENFKLLNDLSKISSKDEYWTNMQLGLYHLSQRQWNDAIIHLRNVIRVKSDSSEVWESLADAYYYRGAYTSAVKCYQRVLDFSDKINTYALTQLASIQNLIQEYSEAVKSYEKVLLQDMTSVVALKGLADTWFNLAEDKLSQNLFGASQFSAQRSIIYLTEALKVNTHYICLWQKLADVLTLLTKLPNKYSAAFIDNVLFGVSDDDISHKKKEDLFKLAIASYSKCINLQPDAALYYNLSLTYYEYFKYNNDPALCQTALLAAQQCVKLSNNQWQYWNHLGVVYMSPTISRLDMAQHCLIKGLNCDQTNANSWSNLGILYMKLGMHVLANQAFKRAQQSDPNFLQSWIGQAIIAEKVKEEEAMDLFRHASQLGYHRESAFGYADWVCKTLQNSKTKTDYKYRYAIENMHAIPVALDLMVWMCENEPSNSCALTLRGLLQERMSLLKSAFKSFTQAQESQKLKPNDALLINLGRIQLQFGLYEEAVQNFKNVKEGSLESVCGLALAYKNIKNYEECYSTYNAAIHWLANSDQDKAELFVAMASMMYALQNFDDAKTLLFQGIQICPQKPSAPTLFATCALGLLHSDPSLSKLALGEIRHYELDSSYSYDVGYLKSYLLYQENKLDQALKSLCQSIHNFPDVSELWFCLGKYFLQECNLNPKKASIFSQKALVSGLSRVDITKLLGVASISEQLCNNMKQSLVLALRALHVYPNLAENWAALISVLLPTCLSDEKKKWLKEIIGQVRRKLEVPKKLTHWLGITERFIEQA